MKLPEGFTVEDRGHALLVLHRECRDALAPLLERPPVEDDERFAGARWLEGRGPIPSVPLADGRRVVIRTYRHGGLLRGFTRDLFVGLLPRPIRELALSERARGRGIPTPRVLGAAVYPVLGPMYRGALAVEELPDGSDGLEVLRHARELSALARRRVLIPVLAAAGRAVARAHAGGLVHSDLNVKNLFAVAQPLQVHVLDLDRCRLEPGALAPWQRQGQLSRLRRSLDKVTGLYGLPPLTKDEIDAFLAAYAAEGRLTTADLRLVLEGIC